MKNKINIVITLILIGSIIGCKNIPEDFQSSKAIQTSAETKNQKTEPPVEDSLTLNEFKRITRTNNYEDNIDLGSYGNVQMPTSYSVIPSSIRHLGGGYYGAIIYSISNPVMSFDYIEFHPIHNYSTIQVFSAGAGRSTQFSNWTFEEVNENLPAEEVPYFENLLNVLEDKKKISNLAK